MEFIITQDSFQYIGNINDTRNWQEDKYRAWYEMVWKSPDSKEAKSLSERLFYNLAYYFHKSLSSSRDINLLRENVEFSYDEAELKREVFTGELINYIDQVNSNWLDQQFSHLLACFQTDIKNYSRSVTEYYNDRGLNFPVPDRIFFHLVEAKEHEYPFAFMASYSEEENGSISHHPLSHAIQKYSDDQGRILVIMQSIIQASKNSSLIKRLMQSGELFHPIYFTSDEAYQFLNELEIYENAGIKCRIPDWWTQDKRKHTVSIKVDEGSRFGQDAILSLKPEFSIGDLSLTRDELESFLKLSQGLRMFKGNWVEVDHQKIKQLLEDYDSVEDEIADGLTLQDTLRLSVDNEELVDIDDVLDYFQTKIKEFQETEPLDLPASFQAELRPYQEDGRQWLLAMDRLGMGVILADDMGLGKTIQILAYLETKRFNEGNVKALVVLPTSLLANWEEEIKKFAPTAPYKIYHGREREISDFITLTTYGILRRDEDLINEEWDAVILDEAQAIKNPNTLQTKAVKKLNGHMKIAMTGTPIENDLMDLYSLFDFIQPGYLGTTTEFKSYAYQLSQKEDGYTRLRQAVSPFILRRLKTDKNIIKDLPQKLERKEYIDLSNKQSALYRSIVDNFEKKLADAEGIDRRGLVLSTLTGLKQVINHPDQYTGLENYKPSDSGKFGRLAELVGEIYARRERVLIFTQYREIIPHLEEFLEKSLGNGVEGLILHGGTPAGERQDLVRKFNGDTYYPFMILSLKAGGVGLNLTGANHVIHFDRWWNPQVERQATDRAYRIGQEKDVMVHYFICRDTIDERIDEMLDDKIALSEEIITENKAPAITEMSDQELRDFFALRKE